MSHITAEAAYQELCQTLGLVDYQPFCYNGGDPVCPSAHRIGDATAIVLSVLGSELASLWKYRTNKVETFSISIDKCVAQLMAVFLTTVNSIPCVRLLEDPKLLSLNGFLQAKDGRWIFLLHTYPHLRDINCSVLNCPFEQERLAEEVRKWNAFDLEEAINARGGTCIAVRSTQEWSADPAGAYLEYEPLLKISKIGDCAPQPFGLLSGTDIERGSPLQGIKVLDNTHVIAGPMSSRIAAEFGANVLSMVSPDHKDPMAMIAETAIGKRSCWCDLNNTLDQTRFWKTLREADVYVSSYLSLDSKGFGPEQLIAQRPGLVYVDYHAFGATGPWAKRHGFDQLACAATGFSMREGAVDGKHKPSLPPTHLLNDYFAAVLGAAGMIEALKRRATEGGSWRVQVNLSKACMWIQNLGAFSAEDVRDLKKPSIAEIREAVGMAEVDGKLGVTRYLPTQIQFEGGIKPGFTSGAEPQGASRMEW